ncbi:DUF3949 domain-containing protein [Bacillus sp. B-jedd]|uniref:DUF3949 domain-containing protein n=1 Tax=Bacillus sp. B-jedd TaxID=1476857 RepID=UPI00066296D3|nr:DUF3949 domain-containing protein [Bacillus sp. B-jedd]
MRFLWVPAAYLLLSLLFLPFQYQYIKQLKERRRRNERKGISQSEMVERMSFEEQQLTFNVQGNFLFMGSNLLAEGLYYLKHRKDKNQA